MRVPWLRDRRVDRHFALNIDLASTITQLAGVRPGLPQDGRSLVPLLRGKSPPWRDEFVEEYLGESMLSDAGPPPFRALRTKRWMYVEYLNGWRELYDLEHDPYELVNRAHDPALAALRGRPRPPAPDARASLAQAAARPVDRALGEAVRLLAVERDDLLEDRERLGPCPVRSSRRPV